MDFNLLNSMQQRDQMSALKGLYNTTRPAEYNQSYPFTIFLLWCESKLVQYLLTKNKAFQWTLSEKPVQIQQTD